MDNKKLLGKRIKEIRKQKNLTQEQLAELIQIETGSLSAIESGRHFPSLPTLEKISTTLDVELKQLFEFNHLVTAEKMKDSISKNIDSLSTEKLAFIYQFVESFKQNLFFNSTDNLSFEVFYVAF